MPIAEDGSTVSDGFYATPVAVPLGKRLAAIARQFAAESNAKLAEAPQGRRIKATIVGVDVGGGSDGNALVTVRWRGSLVVANGYNRSYTPVVGHRVVCDYIDNELTIDYSPVGFP